MTHLLSRRSAQGLGYDDFLAVQNDGNVVVHRADGGMLWTSGTNH
jgi:hypothetical protein